MKKKNYLLALALPAVFAACTQDELVNADKGTRKLVEIPIENFSLTVNAEKDNADTRVTTGAISQWESGDKMGLVWFNPFIITSDGVNNQWQCNEPVFFANNMMTIASGATNGVWKSDANIMQGKHFAYFPYQTKWGDGYLQTNGGQDTLKVYNTAFQEDEIDAADPSKRLHWMMNHQTMLSAAYEFTAGAGDGLSEERAINLHLFSNRLSILPQIVGAPADLEVMGYDLKAVNKNNYSAFTKFKPFVLEGNINANKLPMNAAGFISWLCNTEACDCVLDEMYKATKFTNALSVNYKAPVPVSSLDKFAFLFLPLNLDFVNTQAASTELILVVRTNYGTITIKNVTGQWNSNVTTISSITLNELYFNGTNGSAPAKANASKGFVGVAGLTRGIPTTNGNITATFNFADIEMVPITGVCSNAGLDAAYETIKNYKNSGATTYPTEIELCAAPIFTDLDFDKYISDKNAEIGVNVTVTGINNEGNPGTTITWKGKKNKLASTIPFTKNLVEGTLTTSGTVGSLVTVLNKGTLVNNGTINDVVVEKGGKATNNSAIGNLTNAGTVTNSKSSTIAPDDQPTINYLLNSGTVNNYANINITDNSGTINLLDNDTQIGTNVIGPIFRIGEARGEGEILYTVESPNTLYAARGLFAALQNHATTVTVQDGVNLDASSIDTNDKDYKGTIVFEGTTEFKLGNAANWDSALRVGGVELKPDAVLNLVNSFTAAGTVGMKNYGMWVCKMEVDQASVNIEDNFQMYTGELTLIGKPNPVNLYISETNSNWFYLSRDGSGTVTTTGHELTLWVR